MSNDAKRFRTLSLAIVGALLLGGASSAEETRSECDSWFPDFTCEERQGRYEGFVMPMQMPYLFEDPFITSGFNAVAIYHDYPGSSALGGGEIWVLALQARLAITDRLAFIATKDGYAFNRPDLKLGGAKVLPKTDGFMDIAAGFKYALIDMPEERFILSPSVRIDVPVGERDVFSGNGNGEIIPAVSWAWGATDRLHFVGDIGGRIPFDGKDETSSIFWNLHADFTLADWFVPFFEIGGLHYTSSGDGNFVLDTNLGPLTLNTVQSVLVINGFEGVDVANLGSRGVGGNDVVIATLGARFPLGNNWSLGASYDFPLTSRKDIFKQRATVMFTYDF